MPLDPADAPRAEASTPPPDDDASPEGARSSTTVVGLLRRTVTEFQEDQLADRAAALTYYGLLALFPALIAMVSLVGLVADPVETTQKLTDVVTRLGPSTSADTFAEPIRTLTSNRSGAGLGLIVGLLLALWAASGYVGAFIRASNVVFEKEEGRPVWKLRPLQLVVTFVMVVLTACVALALVLTGPIVDALAEPFGIGDTAVTAWEIGKWPVLVAVVLLIISVLYYASPDARLRGFRWVLPGALTALALWFVASVGFALYVANFGSYSKTYGTLAGIVVFLVWLWLTNLALLLGVEINAERERRTELIEGVDEAADEIQLPRRSEPHRARWGSHRGG